MNLDVVRKVDLDNELYAISSNSVNRLAIGGETKQIDLHEVADILDEEGFLAEPYLAMKFANNVCKIQWFGKYILGFSEESHLSLFNSDTEKVLHFK